MSPRLSPSGATVLQVSARRWLVLWPLVRLSVIALLLLASQLAPRAFLADGLIRPMFGVTTSLWVIVVVGALAYVDEMVIRNERTLLRNAGLPGHAMVWGIGLATLASESTLLVAVGLARRLLA